MRVAIITVDTEIYRGEKEDLTLEALEGILENEEDISIVFKKALPSDEKVISTILQRMADADVADLILTTGGAGCAPEDITPEATMAIVERPVLGIGEAMRAYIMQKTKRAMINRSTAGIRRNSLIVNLPGKEKAAKSSLKYLLPELTHAVEVIRG
ncbi:MAG TPA: MogA/MoaB family molybdenum cofactor biosynthesis protein [Candidatus Dorea intestinavium]|nr:MogA/MoaB family molybdenum cofactor biosynthesis protein [Candidatus Dorea intestinavium]